MKVNNTVRTASVNSARKTSNSKTTSSSKATSNKTTSTAKSSSKATSSKTTSTVKSSSKATSSKTTSTVKSSSKATSSKTTGTSKVSTQASNSKISSTPKTGIQASSNKGLVDAKTKTNTKTSIASTIASKITSSAKSIINSSSKGNSNLTSSNSSSIIGSVTKYIVDAPAIYTSQALKSTIGKDSSSLESQLSKGYVPGMPSDVYNKVKNSTKPKYNGKNPSINKMLSNLDKDKTLKLTSDQKKAMLYAGEKMLNDGYDAKFVAGVLANIKHEGEPGKFESSNYSTHPEDKPLYLKNMDKDFDYTEKYSGKNISEVGIKETVKLQKEASKKKYTYTENGKEREVVDQFGLGMFQFTGARTSALLDEYQAFYNRTKENHPTKEQCLEIEISFALKELKSKNYRTIYESWKEGKKTAYSAGDKFCKKYENPKDKDSQAIIRGNDAEKIYAVMKKK